MDITKNLTKVQLAPEKRRNSLRDEFLLFLILCENLFGSDSSFDALTLPYFFFIKLHAYQFTIYISFEKKLIQKHTVSGMLHVNSLAVWELKVIKF